MIWCVEELLLVAQVLGDVAAEVADCLRDAGEPGLAGSVPRLRFYGRCTCGDCFCQGFYTAPRPAGAYGPGHRNVCLSPTAGMLILDVVDNRIMFVEVLYRPDVEERLQQMPSVA